MKKLILLFLGVIVMTVFFGCTVEHGEPQNAPTSEEKTIKVSITNKLKTADFWIMPDTEPNRKLSLWGTPTVKALGRDESADGTVTASDKYLLHVIDVDEMYYSAVSIDLSDGQSVVLCEGEQIMEAILRVYDKDGTPAGEYSVFMARL